MNDTVRALGIAAGILFPILVLIVTISIAVVRRGEGGEPETAHAAPDDSLRVKDTAVAAAPVKAGKPAAPETEEISVINILLFGTGLFVLAIVLLLALSLIEHAS